MIYAGNYAAAILSAKPAGVALAQFPLNGLPQPAFSTALRRDAVARLYATWVSLGEALAQLKGNQSSWPSVKLYYTCYYALEALLAADGIVTFRLGSDHYIGDSVIGVIKKTGRSSHQINWSVFNSLTRLTRWTYDVQSGMAYAALRSYRELASYNSEFSDPHQRPEIAAINISRLERTFRQYFSDSQLFYTFLTGHSAVAYPVRMAAEAAAAVYSLGLTFNEEQRRHLSRIWPVREPSLW